MKPRVLTALPLPDDQFEALDRVCEPVRPQSGVFPSREEVEALIPELAGVISTVNTRFDADLLARAPKLRVISNCAVGLDNIDIPAASARGILVCNTPGVQDAAVAELAIAFVLALARNMLSNDAYVRSGEWQRRRAAPLGMDVRGKRLGLIGMGGIGRHVARLAHAIGMDVVYFKRTRDLAAEAEGIASYAERNAVLASADFLSVHAPLTEATRGLIGRSELARMKQGAFLINTARGPIVDEVALIAALASGHLAGAGLDVMAVEPLATDSPLCAMRNVILQPHAAGATRETRRNMERAAVANLVAVLDGERPPILVNPEALAAIISGGVAT